MDDIIERIIVVVINVLFLPVYIIIFINHCRVKKSVFTLINILLTSTCMINSISYLIYQKDNPEEKGSDDSNDILCRIQSSILVFGDVSRLALAIGYIVVAYLTFLDPTTVEVHKFRFFIIILIVCQIMPLIFGIICGIQHIEGAIKHVFCFVQEQYFLLSTQIIRYVMVFVFYIMIVIFQFYFRKTFKEQSNEEFYKSFQRKIIRYAILITFTLILLICFTVSDIVVGMNNNIFVILNILNGILNPLYVLFFVLNRSKYEELKHLICCKKQIEDENYLDDEYQMEIV